MTLHVAAWWIVSGQVSGQVYPGSRAKSSIRANASLCYPGSRAKSSIRAEMYSSKPARDQLDQTCLPVEQEDMSSCRTRRHVFLLNKKTCLLVGQEYMSSCLKRKHVFLLNKKTCLLYYRQLYPGKYLYPGKLYPGKPLLPGQKHLPGSG